MNKFLLNKSIIFYFYFAFLLPMIFTSACMIDADMGAGDDGRDSANIPPKNAAVSVSFSDLDPQGSKINGNIVITKASDESNITHYVLYWGLNSVTKSGPPIISLPKTGSNLTYTFAENSPIPTNVTHLLVFTQNTDWEMATGISYLIIDLGVPTTAAISMSFTDMDLDGGELQGDVRISVPTGEEDFTHCALYWGKNAEEKKSKTPITIIKSDGDNRDGDNLFYKFEENTPIPNGATHLLVFTQNAQGEMATGVNTQIIDKGVPLNAAVSLAFSDTDPNIKEIQGDLSITKASDESDITHYALYWGSDAVTKTDEEIVEIEKTGDNLVYTFRENSKIPDLATHLLVFSCNADAEMATGINLKIIDLGVPTQTATSLTFTDIDLNGHQIQGDVQIGRATNEADLDSYVLYWGKSALKKYSPTSIASVHKSEPNLVHSIREDTTIPDGATHILVFTKKEEGEMATGLSILIEDKGVPVHEAANISFIDEDPESGQIKGVVEITQADNEEDLTHYALYWGTSSTEKFGTYIAKYDKSESNSSIISHTFSENTALPDQATHLLVFTRFNDFEMSTGISILITDLGVPKDAAKGVSFTDDLDLQRGEIQGTVTIEKADNEDKITHYALYWGTDALSKLGPLIAKIPKSDKSDKNVTYTFSQNTSVPPKATHFLVFTKNESGEMATGVSTLINDLNVIYVDSEAGGSNNGSDWTNAYTTIQQAMNTAQPGDTLWVAEGIYTPAEENSVVLTMKEEVNVYGGFAGTETAFSERPNPTLLSTIISGDYNGDDFPGELKMSKFDNACHVVVGANNSTLDGFTIKGGYADKDDCKNKSGGGMYNKMSSPLIENVMFTENYASNGGGMSNINNSATLRWVTFSKNEAKWNGGGMYNNYSSVTVNDSTFDGNIAGEGGGIYNVRSDINLKKIVFKANNAKGNGGGIANQYSSPEITQVTLTANSANYGAGIYNNRSNLAISQTLFRKNSSKTSGGGLYNYKSSPTVLTDVKFLENTSVEGSGGGMKNDSHAKLMKVSFYRNSAGTNGGGLADSSNLDIENTIFNGNEAKEMGGGIYFQGSRSSMKEVIVSKNTAGKNGGGIAVFSSYKPTDLILTNITILDNSADIGGGLYIGRWLNDDVEVKVFNTTITGNMAATHGGAVANYYKKSKLDLRNVTIANNISGDNVGGIYNSGLADANIVNSAFWGNRTDVFDTSSDSLISNTCSEDTLTGIGNVTPGSIPFKYAVSGEVFLVQNSNPCINNSTDNDSSAPGDWGNITTSIDGSVDTGTIDMGRHYNLNHTWIKTFTEDTGTLSWTTYNAASCTIRNEQHSNVIEIDPANLTASSISYLPVLGESSLFTMTCEGSEGLPASAEVIVP